MTEFNRSELPEWLLVDPRANQIHTLMSSDKGWDTKGSLLDDGTNLMWRDDEHEDVFSWNGLESTDVLFNYYLFDGGSVRRLDIWREPAFKAFLKEVGEFSFTIDGLVATSSGSNGFLPGYANTFPKATGMYSPVTAKMMKDAIPGLVWILFDDATWDAELNKVFRHRVAGRTGPQITATATSFAKALRSRMSNGRVNESRVVEGNFIVTVTDDENDVWGLTSSDYNWLAKGFVGMDGNIYAWAKGEHISVYLDLERRKEYTGGIAFCFYLYDGWVDGKRYRFVDADTPSNEESHWQKYDVEFPGTPMGVKPNRTYVKMMRTLFPSAEFGIFEGKVVDLTNGKRVQAKRYMGQRSREECAEELISMRGES